ncbi:hypothetical protein BGC40_07460 [Brucella melitensis]|nr:hypothetical protein BGC40_07460 [Brucella melitensis]
MIPVPPALESHLQGEVTTHCFAWLIRRLDGAVLGFTDHDAPLTVDQVICDPLTGLNSSEASTALGLGIAGGEVEGVLSSTQISDEDIEQGRYDGATIEAFLVNWDEPDQHMLLRRWAAGKISRSGSRFVMELKGVAAAFDAVRGRRILRHCDAMLGDKRCGIDTGDPRFLRREQCLSPKAHGLMWRALMALRRVGFPRAVLRGPAGPIGDGRSVLSAMRGQACNLASR